MFAMVNGLSEELCLLSGVASSGYYVRTGKSASLSGLAEFLQRWAKDALLDVKRNNISYNISLPVWRAIFLPCPKKPYSAGFAAMQ